MCAIIDLPIKEGRNMTTSKSFDLPRLLLERMKTLKKRDGITLTAMVILALEAYLDAKGV